jgi:endonuclease/exonuclease/phosphatase family metal-dependent hydrolase
LDAPRRYDAWPMALRRSPAALDKPDSVLLLQQAGFTEAWQALHANDPGYTWPLFLEDHFPAPPFTSPAAPFERIDLIFVRGPLEIRAVERTGLVAPYGSDHSGVVATLKLEP